MTFATFTGCSRLVRSFSQQYVERFQRDAYGLQIRVDRFDSDTRLNTLADSAFSLSTNLSTFLFRACSVRRRAQGRKG